MLHKREKMILLFLFKLAGREGDDFRSMETLSFRFLILHCFL